MTCAGQRHARSATLRIPNAATGRTSDPGGSFDLSDPQVRPRHLSRLFVFCSSLSKAASIVACLSVAFLQVVRFDLRSLPERTNRVGMHFSNRLCMGVLLGLLLASCGPDNDPGAQVDDPSIPGDERAGFFICHGEPGTQDVRCGPGTECCTLDSPVCVPIDQGCEEPYDVVWCDGPEDCSRPGDRCITQSHGTSCTTSEGHILWCHVDADCAAVQDDPTGGRCDADGTCHYPAPPNATN